MNVANEHSDAPLCPDCHAQLANDQSYCINCGLPVAGGREPGALIAAAGADPVAAGSEASPGGSGRRLVLLPGLEMSLGLAVAVFALVLGLGAWAGAASMQGGGPLRYALAGVTGQGAPATTPPATGDSAAGADLGSDPLATDTFDSGSLDAGVASTEVTTAPVAPGGTGGGSGGGGSGGGGGTGDNTDESAAPELTNVWLISLGDQSFEKLYDTAGAAGTARASSEAPYLATTLTRAGALIPDLFAVTRGALAGQVALVSGQGPNADTRNGCPSFAPVSDAAPGKYDQAPASGCGFPANYATIVDLLTGASKRWKVYAGVADRLDGGAPTLCRQPATGARPPAGAVPFPLFSSFTGDPECATKVAAPSALIDDLADKGKTPAFSYIAPGPCEDASDTPCAPDAPAGVAPANAFLRRTVEAIQQSAAYKAGGAIVITATQSPAGGENPDNSACCEDRPWYGKDTANAGGGRVGALILSPLVKGKTVVDGRFDHYDLLRTIADGLGVRRPGLAASPKVSGLPRSTWSAWNGKKPGAAKPVD